MLIDGIQFEGLDQGRDDAPVCGSGIVTCEGAARLLWRAALLRADGRVNGKNRLFDSVVVGAGNDWSAHL